MKLRTWPILALGFGIIVALIAFTGLSALRGAKRIFGDISTLHSRYQESERILNEIRNDLARSGLLVRDFLLDPSGLTPDLYRDQLLGIRRAVPGQLDELRSLIGTLDPDKLSSLQLELDGYWNALDPIFEWTPQQKRALSSIFLTRQVLPRRNAAAAIAREIRELNQSNLARQRNEIEQKESELTRDIGRMLTITLVLGLLVAAGAIFRITRLEMRAESQRVRTEAAEREMRSLSQQLLKAHEEERRHISRELHDEIGQMLTAQRMELRSLKMLRNSPDDEFLAHLEASARLSEEALKAVRGLALGLRPSMLDDLGLGPAIEWQGREFSRRFGVPVTVQLEGPLDNLPDSHRTCVYRIVQEALTNCARHAHARNIRIAVHGRLDRLNMLIQDDGVGFSTAECRGRGLGLIGIEERVKELGGTLFVDSQPSKGTVLAAEIPVTSQKEAAAV
jgi:signal transduction histidine kinase